MKDEKLEEMKCDYKNIPIPTELKARVINSMHEAKDELGISDVPMPLHSGHSAAMPDSSNHNSSSKLIRFRKLTTRIVGVSVAAMLAIIIMANSSETISYAMGNIPFLGTIARIVTFREYSHTQNDMEANIKVPAISVENTDGTPIDETTTELNQQIEAYTNQIIAAYETDIKNSDGQLKESLELDYEIITDNDRLFTLRFDETILTASSMHSIKIYNLDKATGNLITLEDIFEKNSDFISIISENIKEQMKKQMEADKNITYFYESDMPENDFTEITADENFYISDNGQLTIVFDKYEVAPGYMGSVEFEIPTEVITDIIKEGYVN